MITTLISRKKTIKLALLFAVGFIFASFTPSANAQESLTLSISPSLFDMSVQPGQEWRSSLRVINVNEFDLTVYIDVVNFEPQGEGGDGRFLPVPEGEASGGTLAEWFSIDRQAIVIPREQSKEIPFSVRVPFDASPGGHFAAILVGTKPPVPEAGQARVQTSQMVTSLFFTRVAGDINELGTIREFTTTAKYLNSPEATFEMRFENKGNVHLQPQGDIVITNMWGQERGVIPINHGSQFGNVLPNSIRKFTFSWKGEWSMSDIGRYTALATLAYGTESRQFTSSEINFWVIPFKLLFGILLGLAVFIFVITWLVKLYVRKMLVMAGIDVNEYKSKSNRTLRIDNANRHSVKIHSPIQAGILDFKQRLRMTSNIKERIETIGRFIYQYQIFFGGVAFAMLSLFLIYWYVSNATTDHRAYEIEYVNSDAKVKLTSEEIIYNQFKTERNIADPVTNSTLPKISIVNRSGVPGYGAETKIRLESLGYQIVSLEADFTSPLTKTVILAKKEDQTAALRLSTRLNNALISTSEEDQLKDKIIVYVGDDIETN